MHLSAIEVSVIKKEVVSNTEVLLEEDKLIVLKAKDDPNVFEDVYNKYFEQIYRYCCSRAYSNHDAEDLTMQIFEDAYKSFHKFRWQNKPIVAWLYRIAHNHLYDYRKAKAKQKTVELDEANGEHHSDIAEKIASKDQADGLMKHFKKLPDIYQQVMFLRLCEDKSFAEISLIVGKKETACRVLACRALQKLKKEAARGGVLDA